jgi:hypothetical protein
VLAGAIAAGGADGALDGPAGAGFDEAGDRECGGTMARWVWMARGCGGYRGRPVCNCYCLFGRKDVLIVIIN